MVKNASIGLSFSTFVNKIPTIQQLLAMNEKEITELLWKENPDIKRLLIDSNNTEKIRNTFFSYLNTLEKNYFAIDSSSSKIDLPSSTKGICKQSIRILKNLLQQDSEKITGFSALKALMQLAGEKEDTQNLQSGFLVEFLYLFRSIKGFPTLLETRLNSTTHDNPAEEKVQIRSEELNMYSQIVSNNIKRFQSGYEEKLIQKRESLKLRILEYWNAEEQDWNNWEWHIAHIIDDLQTLSDLVYLEKDEIEGLKSAETYGIPFQITPYYLSLFNMEGRCDWDRAIRAQVIPSRHYCEQVHENHVKGGDMDFMGEKWTSPVETITRRYPQILILKPFDSCPQICVYCQRNWEIKKVEQAHIPTKKIHKAIDWIRNNPAITEVLVTGGDPFHLDNDYLDNLFGELSRISHVQRIRIGTRIPVTIPQRIDEGLLQILDKYHLPGTREVCIVTHFEHGSEITPSCLEVIQKIRRLGISIYNQQVFTYYNSRRFETAHLRKTLKISGIDPYYSFNTKGKKETIDYRVPIARLEQERNEEARLLPGIERTDEPVFNVPRIGKSHLRAWQNHEPIMILPDGQRVYRFYPWEGRLKSSDDYIYTDVSIYKYLRRLSEDGEDPDNYQSIWYYY